MAYRHYLAQCNTCRYRRCKFQYYPCVEGLKQICKGEKCSLHEPRLLIQKILDKLKGELV